jgi:regulator of replication initiation timing
MSIAGLLRQESAAWKAEAERAATEMQALRLENEALQKRLRVNNYDNMRMLAELEEIERNLRDITGWKDNITTMLDALGRERNSLRKRLESAVVFRINTAPSYINNVDVMRCEGPRLPKQPHMWKVLSGSGAVLGKDGEWAHEPIPSSRDDKFYAMYRFDTLEEAEAAARKDLEVQG